jgi:hypothetical protein
VEVKTLQDAINDIMNAIESTLKAKINIDGGKLSDVKSLIIGNKTSMKPKTPALWVMQSTGTMEEGNRVCYETWSLEIVVISVIYNTDTQEGYQQANDLVCRAKNVLLADRTLGFGHGTFFGDIVSVRYEGNNTYFQTGNLFSAAYTCAVKFTVRE